MADKVIRFRPRDASGTRAESDIKSASKERTAGGYDYIRAMNAAHDRWRELLRRGTAAKGPGFDEWRRIMIERFGTQEDPK